jgi:MFS family permease
VQGRIAVILGNFLEFYDFLVFTFFAVMIADALFPGESEIVRLLGALATFGAGFLTRPLGAAVIGAYADRAGRRGALSLTLVLMSIGSAMVAVTPSYARIGVAAPAMLLLARLIQGFSAGGEVGAATTYLLESAPRHRRAAMAAWQGHSQQLATIFGSFVGVVLAAALTREQLYAWGWRVPFLIGVLIGPVGLYIRRRLPDTGGPSHQTGGGVLKELLRHHTRSIALGVLIICGGTVSTYIFNYMTTFAITTLKLSASVGTVLTFTGAVAGMGGLAAGVWLDRFGRKTMLIAARVVFVAVLYPCYIAITSPDATARSIVTLNVLLNFLSGAGLGAIYAFLAESFPRSVRSSGLGLVYALGVTIFGGTTQFVVAWLIERTGNPMVLAWYQLAATLASIAGVWWLMPDPEIARGES